MLELNTSPKEIEFKYDAKNISLFDFIRFCKKTTKTNYLLVEGKDHFYGNDLRPDEFYRHRVGSDMNQMTYKKKLCKENNYIRIEYNLDLDLRVTKGAVEAMIAKYSFRYNTTLIKTAFIFETKKYTAVYYICYNEDREEVGRFIELEMAEKYPWKDERQAMAALKVLEKKFSAIGTNPRARVKDSLWEMYKK